jgi:hypothetical protein
MPSSLISSPETHLVRSENSVGCQYAICSYFLPMNATSTCYSCSQIFARFLKDSLANFTLWLCPA